jgi:hypothetical protein
VFFSAPQRVELVVKFVASQPPELRPIGLMFEEPTAEAFPFEIGGWLWQQLSDLSQQP